ncbi:MAG: TetR/AcrR family transcriptional regulator, partial [Clostridia bacterium]|nr:TetR/AcrR family transcriptional regulator [Clostridia bacterium]
YNATGIQEILEVTGVPKGSFYFHFASKKDLADKVSEYYVKRIERWHTSTAAGKSWDDFISCLISDMKELHQQGKHLGCPLAVLGGEMAFLEPELSLSYAHGMKRITQIFQDVLERSGLEREQAWQEARRAFAIYQGYLQLFRLTKEEAYLEAIEKDLVGLVKNCQAPK